MWQAYVNIWFADIWEMCNTSRCAWWLKCVFFRCIITYNFPKTRLILRRKLTEWNAALVEHRTTVPMRLRDINSSISVINFDISPLRKGALCKMAHASCSTLTTSSVDTRQHNADQVPLLRDSQRDSAFVRGERDVQRIIRYIYA